MKSVEDDSLLDSFIELNRRKHQPHLLTLPLSERKDDESSNRSLGKKLVIIIGLMKEG